MAASTIPVSDQAVANGYERILELARFAHTLVTPPMRMEQFVEFSQRFPEFRMEREPNGQINIMPPVYFGSANRESEANGFIWQWNRQTQLGKTLSASGGIHLPDGSTRQADAAWVSNEKLAQLDAEILDGIFLPVVPDFVVEILSETDNLDKAKTKMIASWIANGVRLAWLIDPYSEKAWIYRANGSVDVMEGFNGQILSGEDIMPGFQLDLSEFMRPTKNSA